MRKKQPLKVKSPMNYHFFAGTMNFLMMKIYFFSIQHLPRMTLMIFQN